MIIEAIGAALIVAYRNEIRNLIDKNIVDPIKNITTEKAKDIVDKIKADIKSDDK